MGGFPDGLEIDEVSLPDGFKNEFWSRKYMIVNGKVLISGIENPLDTEQEPEPDPLEELRKIIAEQGKIIAEQGKMIAEQDNALVELAEMIAGGAV